MRKRLIRNVWTDGRNYHTAWLCPWCMEPWESKPAPLEMCTCGASVQAGGWVARSYAEDSTSDVSERGEK